MPWPIYLALKQLFPTGRVSFFTLLSVAGVSLGTATLVVTTSVMGGFGHQIQRMIIDTQGEIQIRGSTPIGAPTSGEVATALSKSPEVTAFAPYAAGVVMLEYASRPAFPAIQGFDYERMKAVIPLDRYIVAGSLADLDDDSVILSSILASTLGVRVGDTVSLYTPLMLERIRNNEVLLPRDVRVAGIFQIGHQQLDSSTVLCSLRLMQDLYGLNKLVHGYNVRLEPGADEFKVAADIDRVLPPGTRALTWYESNAGFQAVVRFERNLFSLLMGLLLVIAAFAIMGILLSTVVRKTREIGLIVAMGGKARDVALCFCAQGCFIGVAGAVVGLGLGFTILYYRDAIIRLVTQHTMGKEAFIRAYQYSELPAYTEVTTIILIVVFAILMSTLAGLIPAWRAARLKPVEALRSE